MVIGLGHNADLTSNLIPLNLKLFSNFVLSRWSVAATACGKQGKTSMNDVTSEIPSDKTGVHSRKTQQCCIFKRTHGNNSVLPSKLGKKRKKTDRQADNKPDTRNGSLTPQWRHGASQ